MKLLRVLSLSLSLAMSASPGHNDSGSGAGTEADDTGAATGTLFRPTDLGSTLKFWGKSGQYSAATGIWTDSSGLGNNATFVSVKPSAGTAINSLATVHFPGTVGQALDTPSLTIGRFTAMVVSKITTPSGYMLVQVSDANVNGAYFWASSGNTVNCARSSVLSSKNKASGWNTDNVARSLIWTYGGTHATHQLYIGGTDQSMTNADGTADPGNGTVAGAWGIGARPSGGFGPITGDIGEVVICDSQLTATQIANLAAYSREIWGV